jgi:hypothetical protein
MLSRMHSWLIRDPSLCIPLVTVGEGVATAHRTGGYWRFLEEVRRETSSENTLPCRLGDARFHSISYFSRANLYAALNVVGSMLLFHWSATVVAPDRRLYRARVHDPRAGMESIH